MVLKQKNIKVSLEMWFGSVKFVVYLKNIVMKNFENYLYRMGYSWNDFDHTYQMEGLIEQYAKERVEEVVKSKEVSIRCADCGDLGWLYDAEGNRLGTCPCHY